MREIKFRAWDKEHNFMFNVREITFEDNKILAWRKALPEEFSPEIGRLVGTEAELMQYTGLKDKNGKKIYEGDIVTYLDGNEWSTESGYDCEEFLNIGVINFDTEYARFDVTNKESADYEEVFEGGGDFEVLGNIFENPELVEGK